MKITVVCSECKLPFIVEGGSSAAAVSKRWVLCPYPECEEPNEIEWPADDYYKVIPIYRKSGK
jgi:hypothetical protein